MGVEQGFSMVLVGFILGFLSGLFGVGGSSIATPLLRLLDIPRYIALATPLPVTLPIAVVGGLTYWRRGFVQPFLVFWTVIGGLPTILLGAYLTSLIPGRLLMALTGLFVTVVGIRLLQRPLFPESKGGKAWCSPPALIGIGAVVGFLSGLLANGGGFLLVPAYLILCQLDTPFAAANSLVAVALLGIPGTWMHWRLGHIDFPLALLLATGSIPATYLGARVGLALEEKKAKRIFGLFLLSFGLFFLLRTLYRAEVYGWWG